MKALHRWMQGQAAAGCDLGVSRVPPLTALHDAVRREQRAGRVLEVSRPSYARRDPQGYDRALAELALPGTLDEAGRARPVAAERDVAGDDSNPTAAVPLSPPAEGARLYEPGAHVVSTR